MLFRRSGKFSDRVRFKWIFPSNHLVLHIIVVLLRKALLSLLRLLDNLFGVFLLHNKLDVGVGICECLAKSGISGILRP